MSDRFSYDEIDLGILSFIAQHGKATRYDITPHGRTRRKSVIEGLAPSSAKLRLERLERNGYLYATREAGSLGRRFYRLTIKGFLYFLTKVARSETKRTLLRQAVEVYGPILKYPIERRETLHGKEAVEAAKKRGLAVPNKTSYAVDDLRVDFKPIFPLYYHEALRKDLGEEPYFRSLINAACLAHADAAGEEATDRLFFETVEGKRLLAWRQKRRKTLQYRVHEEKMLVRNFELAFLNDVFGINWLDLTEIVPFRFPHRELFDHVKGLLDEEIRNIDDKKDRVEFIRESAFKHFDPNISPEMLDWLKAQREKYSVKAIEKEP